MTKTETMNKRLKILLVNFAYSGLLNIVTRYISIAWYLADSKWFSINGVCYQIIFRLHDLCVIMLVVNPVVIAIERTIATIFPKNYEDFECKICNYILRILSWILSILLICTLYFIISDDSTIFFIVLMILLNILTFITFSILFYINKKRFLNVGKDIQNSLSHKYQIAENIRTSKMLAIFIAQITIVQIILQSMLSVIYFYFVPKQMFYEYEIYSNIFDIINAIFLTTFPLPILLSHKETKKLFCIIFNKKNSKVGTTEPKNVFGKDLIIHNTNCDNIEMLHELWK
ncbi:7TM GPCR, serpentine receptor class e (Sre) family and GPCR, rhodopsin-like, 7TM domain-containing protein [Strongyloides ratti]|uniref:7TM GPCR, serpentine receptor class e (Sre) family and GPCR, rhodopsin-like, 7TM domain-containing protein n=1 Tax=Strongyloides ratti TaxID=34506 RepID=A0A090N0L9_STRRB|nr:7TM GPCR, serpentine receptor class e (Sre) family and GPCR, rhodopsin-like, 7TM domain-containing protein [Strongyloides ratti]CEF70918.1 7TM GPCR, serpentine receptor class e (Sre) family and GPCR, rhodopsin-like, 7TM domain-containing protein [Strongyloides ratti]